MVTAKQARANLEFLLVKAELKGIPEKGLLRSRNIGQVDSITEPVSVQKVRRFLRLTAKYALKMGADFMEKAMVGYADIASSPIDALVSCFRSRSVPARAVEELGYATHGWRLAKEVAA